MVIIVYIYTCRRVREHGYIIIVYIRYNSKMSAEAIDTKGQEGGGGATLVDGWQARGDRHTLSLITLPHFTQK